jgi:hypothetical protein
MSAAPPLSKHAAERAARERRPRTTGGADLGQASDRDSRRVAAAILEVLAGVRTPTEAATALAVSLPRYYQLESAALQGLLAACRPKARGPTPNADKELTALRRDNQRLQREVGRQQALVRAAQCTVGLAAPPPAPPKAGKRKRRRPTARALSVAARLQAQNATPQPGGVPATATANGTP